MNAELTLGQSNGARRTRMRPLPISPPSGYSLGTSALWLGLTHAGRSRLGRRQLNIVQRY